MTALRSTLAALLCSLLPLSAAPLITEFLASNDSGLRDEDGSREDWVEIHNPDEEPVNLGGWYLTDNAGNKTKWRFPDTTIPARGYLIVFCSDKNRAVAGQPLHTNFGLSAGGEYLGLIRPDGTTVAHEYSPSFPQQYADLSYGIPGNSVTATLIAENAPVRWIVPASTTEPDASWIEPDAADDSWNSATLGLGFSVRTGGVDYLPEIGEGGNLEAALYGNGTTQSCYVRIPFTAPAGITSLTLRVKYDDGFAGWLNGKPLLSGETPLRRNAPTSLSWNSFATQINPDGNAIQYEEFDISGSIPDLTAGENLLAFQVLNESATSRDALFRIELRATHESGETTVAEPGYFSVPTPGAPNGGPDTLIIPASVSFSHPQGTFTDPFSLTLTGAAEGLQILYTTDGSLPTASSPVYQEPLPITYSQLVRARLYDPENGRFGFSSSSHYEKLDDSLANYQGTGQAFRSALPILVINNLGYNGEFPNDDVKRDIRLHVFDRDGSGYASLASVPDLSTTANGRIRGSSSATWPKKSYSIEFTNETGDSTDAEILGMEGEDFALVSCYDFDRPFMRNAWIYEMARQSGYWSPRTRLVELFFNQNNNNLSYGSATASDYRGVYLLTEIVRRDTERVDITKLETTDTELPSVSGGYILKIDRADPDEFHWRTQRNLPPAGGDTSGIILYRPKLEDLTSVHTEYIQDYFQRFEDALFTERQSGFSSRTYQDYIEPRSWVDHNLFNMFPKNVDALRLSSYLQKDRGRRIEGGPLWDFDRSAGNNSPYDHRDADPTGWNGTGDSTRYHEYSWWGPLFDDIEFRQLYVDRWQELRRGPLSPANIAAVLEGFYQEFRTDANPADNPATRDYAKWYGGSGDFTAYTNELKQWIEQRGNWIDAQFVTPPAFSLAAGPVASGDTVSIDVPNGTSVYYTLDGSDPRAVGGDISPDAVLYDGSPIPLTHTSLLTARSWRSGASQLPATQWSGPLAALYPVDEPYASPASLLVSAIHFHPTAPSAEERAALLEVDASDFSWIELINASAVTINLEGISLVKERPVSLVTLPPRSLAPGERAVLVKNRKAFTFRYGAAAAAHIVAEWSGDKRLDPEAADIRLLARDGSTRIADFEYETEWIGAEAATGKAMEYVGPDSSSASYETASHWRASADVGGAPGGSTPEPPSGYASWQQEMFPGETANIAPHEDFDHDQIPNLIEYLLGTDPRSHTSGAGVLVMDPEHGPALDYAVRIDRTDASLRLFQSLDLETWTPAEHDQILSIEESLQQRRAFFPAGGRGFLRFEAETSE